MKYSKYLLIIAIIIGLFTRGYQLYERLTYSHDSDLSAWVYKDLMIDHHFRLIGQLTSSPGIFIGPLFYYSLVPFYYFSHLNPETTAYYSLFIGMFAIFSIYYVSAKMWGKTPAAIAALIYAASYSIVYTEREVVPTTPIFLWSTWFLYSLHMLSKGHRKGLLLSIVLYSLVWHIQLSQVLLIPITLVVWWPKKHLYSIKQYASAILTALVLNLPLLVFEMKHGFIQTKSLFTTFSSASEIHQLLVDKLARVFEIYTKNANVLFWDRPSAVPQYLLPLVIIFLLLFFSRKNPQIRKFTFWFLLWTGIQLAFFVRHPINLSEYYINSLNILWISAVALILTKFGNVRWLIVMVLVYSNVLRFTNSTPNMANNFLARSSLVSYIASDAKLHNYPCIAISYITDPGYSFGYRFLFYRLGLHVNQPNSNSPVYTIVFPQSRVDRLDRSFGAIGLIYPDYNRYSQEAINKSCSGQDANQTDPMFGFTK